MYHLALNVFIYLFFTNLRPHFLLFVLGFDFSIWGTVILTGVKAKDHILEGSFR